MSDVVAEITGWVQAPFSGKIDMAHLFLLTGLVLCFTMVWIMILYHIRIAAETL